MVEKYGVGLDIGTNSVGWSVVDSNGRLKRVKGKVAIGARLFKEGSAAAERRGFRTTRRRLKRVKWRLRLLREIFDAPIAKIDPEFFARRKYSEISPRDRQYDGLAKTLFNDRTDKAFYDQYPTIYHLRQALMTEKRQFDLREIYLAMHHIVKYRGNFLRTGSAASYQTVPLNLVPTFEKLNDLWSQLDVELGLTLTTDEQQLADIKAILLRADLSRSDRQKQILPLLYTSSDDSTQKKLHKSVATELAKALVGNKTKIDVLTRTEIDPSDKADWSFEMGSLQDALPAIESDLVPNAMDILMAASELFAAINLAQLIPEGMSFSQSMIAKYDRHKRDLKQLKDYVDSQTDMQRSRDIRATYDHYIAGINGKPVSQADFYKELSKFTKAEAANNSLAAAIETAMAAEEYMPKLRTKQNGSIPYQVQQNELDQIIANQKQYYPWLGTPNPIKKHLGAFPYKLDELVSFRIPYYVGPLITAEDQAASSNAKFAWMQRKAAGAITPWNFDEKVDRVASATKFIQRMQTTDTYLLGEEVLPQQSLIYQRFTVLNELNNVKVDDQPITVKQKQRLFEHVFKQKKTVRVKDVQQELVAAGEYAVAPKITGIADPTKFNSSLSTYRDYLKIIPEALAQPDKQADIEKIIMWSTIFEDTAIFKIKLATIAWLTEEQRKQLSHLRYRGWGQLSRKLLVDFKDENGRSIMDALWETNHNFMVLQSQPAIAEQIKAANSQDLDDADLQTTINQLYTSPQNKKAIREVMLVLADIQTAMHGQAPSWVFVEAARGGGQAGRRTQSRSNQISAIYQSTAKDIVDSQVKSELQAKIEDKATFNDRLVLYFMQNGRDLYTGKAINIDRLSEYDIDHILPQSLVKDDSLDNRVLVAAKINRDKNDTFASQKYGTKMQGYWHQLHQMGLLSSRKLRHLTMRPDEINKYAVGFINRQLVETRQVIKLITNLINAQYEDAMIVSVKAGLSHQFRQTFNFPKLRDVNDYHHAFDAFLAAFIGTYLLKRYPKLQRFFVFGKFKKMPVDMRKFNFIEQLKTSDKPITVPDTGEVIWNKATDLEMMTKIYDFKRILVTREVYENRAAMFNQTIYKVKDNSSKKLIPKKTGFDTDVYGGYSSQKYAYLSIIKVPTKTSFEYRVVGVPTTQLGFIKQFKGTEKEALEAALAPTMSKMNKKTGELVPIKFEVVLPEVRFEQVIRDELKGKIHRFSLGSNTNYHNIQELVLALSVQRKFYSRESTSEDLDDVFITTMDQMNRYFQLYDIRDFRKKLNSKVDSFHKLDRSTKVGVLSQIFTVLHANASLGDLSELGLGKGFGHVMLSGGIKLTSEAQIVYQSPTGLFERQVALKDL